MIAYNLFNDVLSRLTSVVHEFRLKWACLQNTNTHTTSANSGLFQITLVRFRSASYTGNFHTPAFRWRRGLVGQRGRWPQASITSLYGGEHSGLKKKNYHVGLERWKGGREGGRPPNGIRVFFLLLWEGDTPPPNTLGAKTFVLMLERKAVTYSGSVQDSKSSNNATG